MRGQGSDDLATLRKALASAVPQADLDDHRIWAARLGAMADAVVILAAALFALMIVAMGTAIGFATRGAMAGNREIVEVLHLVGASNAFIAREFQAHFRRLGLRGAMIGGLAAIAFFAIASLLSFWWAHSPGGEEIAAMFGSFALRSSGYLALVVVCAAVTLADRSSFARDRHAPFAIVAIDTRGDLFREPPTATMLATRSLLFNTLFYLNLVVLMIIGLPTMLFGRRAVFALARLWGAISVWLLETICGLRLEYRGVENIPPGAVLIAAKHQSFLETFALLKYAPDFAIILKRQLTYVPLFGLYLIVSQQIAIDRGRGRQALNQIAAAAKPVFAAGRQVFIYPEGTRRLPGAPPNVQTRRRGALRRDGGRLPAGRRQHRAVLAEPRLSAPAGRRGDRISAGHRARARPRRRSPNACSRRLRRPATASTRKRSTRTPRLRRSLRKARIARLKRYDPLDENLALFY